MNIVHARFLAASLALTPLHACAAPAAAPADRHLIWADEFNGAALDERCWNRHIEAPPSDEAQHHAYVASPRNAYVRDGALWIDAYRENVVVNGRARTFTSAQLNTTDNAFFTYGYIEARIKVPPGEGAFPAFWMMPENSDFGNWPHSGEIDIFESIGREPNKVYTHIHYTDASGAHQARGHGFEAAAPLDQDFHLYGFEWRPGVLRWYFDDHLVYEVTDWDGPGGAERPHAPFDTSFYLILNLAIGGGWAGPPTSDTPFPMHMGVDYVRVYSLPGVTAPQTTRRDDDSTCPTEGPR